MITCTRVIESPEPKQAQATITSCVNKRMPWNRDDPLTEIRNFASVQIALRRKVAVSQLGKYKTILQIVGLSFMLFRVPLLGLPIYKIGVVLTEIAAAATLYSMVAYLRAAWPELRR